MPQASTMGELRNLNVLAAAEQVADEIDRLLAGRRRLILRGQLRGSAGAISANIRAALVRPGLADRNRVLRIAKGEAEETIGHLRANLSAQRIDRAVFWRLRNRLLTIIKMLDSLIRSP
jgi:four helix bundle protein